MAFRNLFGADRNRGISNDDRAARQEAAKAADSPRIRAARAAGQDSRRIGTTRAPYQPTRR